MQNNVIAPIIPRVGDLATMDLPLSKLTKKQIEALNWYYRMELKPGVFTGGHNVFTNMIPTASMLRCVDVEGLNTLDLGGMEGAFSVLLDRAGADVEVYDRIDLSDRIKLVKEAYGSNFKYSTGKTFHQFAKEKIDSGHEGYDFVLFSGVLYHVIEPMLFLHYMKSLIKPGAIVVLETSLIPDDVCGMYFNEKGQFYKGTNYYQVTSSWLDYALRLLGFKIHNVDYIDNKTWMGDGRDVVRCALVAELTEERVIGPRDHWAANEYIGRELGEFIGIPNYQAVDLSDRITRQGFGKHVNRKDLLHNGTRSLNLTKALSLKRPMPIDEKACTRYLEDRLYGGA